MKCAVVREIDSLESLARSGGNLNCTVVQGLDLRDASLHWEELECAGAVFLGCRFPQEVSVCTLQERGALIFPSFVDLPFDPYRPELYSREELMRGWTPEKDLSVDRRIYDHYVKHGKKSPDIVEALAERLHDHAIDDALSDLLEGRVEKDGQKRVVAVMGGHGTGRDEWSYQGVVRLTRRLTQEGYFVASGGGPGTMEAANLGAYLAERTEEEVEWVIKTLAEAPHYTDRGFVAAAQRVIDRFPSGETSLAIPTWFYGHEPTNLFSTHVAKYFSNSIREDGLLTIATHGIVFAPGSAGTTQEIFQDAAQNHYATSGEVSPMVFFGNKRYTEETGIWETIRNLAKGRKYYDYLCLSEEVEEVVNFLRGHPPVASDGVK